MGYITVRKLLLCVSVILTVCLLYDIFVSDSVSDTDTDLTASRKKFVSREGRNTYYEKREKHLTRHKTTKGYKQHSVLEGNNINANTNSDERSPRRNELPIIHIAVVSCRDRFEETLVMIKSALLTSQCPLQFHIFTDTENSFFKQELLIWSKYIHRFVFTMYNSSFPASEHISSDIWKNLYPGRPCASQRLFLPRLLPHLDSVLYMDTDTLLLGPIEEIWHHLYKFNTSQVAAFTVKQKRKGKAWYNTYGRVPFYGDTGINDGIILMNLTRLRSSPWLQKIEEYCEKYINKIALGAQDLINIYFQFYPDQIYLMSCENNYRRSHCYNGSNCEQAVKTGVLALHGSHRVWYDGREPTFKAVFTAFSQVHINDTIPTLIHAIDVNIRKTLKTNCGTLSQAYTKRLKTGSISRCVEPKTLQ